MPNITPFLWFDKEAEEAARFYCSIFPDSEIIDVVRYGDGAPMPKGSVMTVSYVLNGQSFIALNGGPHYQLTPAISFVVSCATQNEIDYYWDELSDGGQTLQCGWLTDRYGVTWQIVPSRMSELLSDADPAGSARVMAAMMGMVKLDIEALIKAHKSE